MGDPVNLNKTRKAAAKRLAEAQAAANRVKFGRGKAEKAADKAAEARRAALLDGARREKS
jgi:hypothetical protein